MFQVLFFWNPAGPKWICNSGEFFDRLLIFIKDMSPNDLGRLAPITKLGLESPVLHSQDWASLLCDGWIKREAGVPLPSAIHEVC